MFDPILVAADGSADADQGLVEAIDLARAQHARLTILTSVPHPTATARLAGVAAVALANELEAEFEAILGRATELVPDDVSVTTILTQAAIRDALVQQVETGRFDLLVMGSRGRGAVRSTLLGSVSHHLLNHSAMPLLVVHAAAPPQVRGGESNRVANAA